MNRRTLLHAAPAALTLAALPALAAAQPELSLVPLPEWRQLRMVIHPAEPGMTHLSFYTSPDGVHWNYLQDGASYAADRTALLDMRQRVVYYPESLRLSLEPNQQFIGVVADQYVRSELDLFNAEGLLYIPPISRDGPELAVHSIFAGDVIGSLCFWDVSGRFGFDNYS